MFSWENFEKTPIVGIIRNISPAIFEKILPLYIQAGFTTIEVTMNTDGAEKMIEKCKIVHGDAINIGAGTVCNISDLEKALDAGAGFIVTPILEKKVIEKCVALGVPVFPGAFTPTEIFTAWSLGASMVKVFPASELGPEFIKSMKAPFPQIKLMPTGGVRAEDLSPYRIAGADAFGIGSPLFPSHLMKSANDVSLLNHFHSFYEKWVLST